MKVFFDQGVPVPLRRHFPTHLVVTAAEAGWSTLANGALLRAVVDEGFDVFITTDQSLPHQQRLSDLPLAVIVLGSTSWPRIQRHVRAVADALAQSSPGTVLAVPV